MKYFLLLFFSLNAFAAVTPAVTTYQFVTDIGGIKLQATTAGVMTVITPDDPNYQKWLTSGGVLPPMADSTQLASIKTLQTAAVAGTLTAAQIQAALTTILSAIQTH